MKISKKQTAVKSNIEVENAIPLTVEEVPSEGVPIAQINSTLLDKGKELIVEAIDCLSKYAIEADTVSPESKCKIKDAIANLSVVALDLS